MEFQVVTEKRMPEFLGARSRIAFYHRKDRKDMGYGGDRSISPPWAGSSELVRVTANNAFWRGATTPSRQVDPVFVARGP
jgi:hypothetical protein